jgi:ubiquitin C-terminal hydrolase
MGGSSSKDESLDECGDDASAHNFGGSFEVAGANGVSISQNHNGLLLASPSLGAQRKYEDELTKVVGLENFGNTCYCNSVIQLLYSCTALRHRALILHEQFAAATAAAGGGGGGFLSSSPKVPPHLDSVLYRFCDLVSMLHKTKEKKKKLSASVTSVATPPTSPGVLGSSATMTTPLATTTSAVTTAPQLQNVVPVPAVVASPNEFVQRVKKENVVFRNAQQQDAHEFAMFVVNCLIENERALLLQSGGKGGPSGAGASLSSMSSDKEANNSLSSSSVAVVGADGSPTTSPQRRRTTTPIQDIFEGSFASETSCMECETNTVRFERFFDLSLEIEQDASLSRCILNFSSPEFLMGAEKFRCDACCASSPARRCVRVHQAPARAMLIHLKRFKYQEERQVFKKLSWRVNLPNELMIHHSCTNGGPHEHMGSSSHHHHHHHQNSSSTSSSQDRAGGCGSGNTTRNSVFRLKGFVVHQGSGPNLGHYICCVRSFSASGEPTDRWKRFDDDLVHDVSEKEVQQYFGLASAGGAAASSNNTTSEMGARREGREGRSMSTPAASLGVDSVVSSSTAYILLYERV